MSIYLYDESLKNKVSGWLNSSKAKKEIKVFNPTTKDNVFQMLADQSNDKQIEFPIIEISRDPDVEVLQNQMKEMSFMGIGLAKTKEKTLHLDAIPIVISYQLDIWGKDFKEVDALVRTFTFKFINDRTIPITLTTDGYDYVHYSNVKLNSTIEDNSDTPQQLFGDQFCRWTFHLVIDDAYMFTMPTDENYSISDYAVEIVEN